MKQWDVIVLGSGISSLTAAAILSAKGKSVLVLEKYSKPGGYMHNFRRFGLDFDTGAHYVGALKPGQPFHTLLSYMGIQNFDELFVPLAEDGFDVFQFPSFQVKFSSHYERCIEELSALFSAERSGIQSFFLEVRRAAKIFPTYEFSVDNDESQLEGVLSVSLGAVVREKIRAPELRAVLFGHCGLHGVKPDDISFGFHAVVLDSLLQSAFGFAEGGDALAEAFVSRIKWQGGTVLTRAAVTKLKVEGKEIREVETSDGEVHRGEWVISGLHPKETFRLIENFSFKPAFRSRLENMKESLGMFGVYAGCTDASAFDRRRNYYFFDSEDPEAEPTGLGPIFLSRPDRVGRGTDLEPLSLLCQNPGHAFSEWSDTATAQRPPEYQQLKEKLAQQVFSQIDGHVKNFSTKVQKYVTSSPLTNIYFNGSEDGSAYGIYHSIQNTGPRALGPRTHVANLLLTGQSTLFPGLLGASISGLRTAGNLLGIKPLIRELMQIKGEA